MAGLLDFVNSPAGIGLLSAMAGGMAGARRGTPVNNIGRGLVTGVQGYAGAKDQLRADEENALTKQYKSLQMQELESKIARHKAMREAATGAYQDASKPAQFSVGGQSFPTQQAAQTSAESMFSLPNGAVPGFLGDAPQEARSMAFNPTGELPQPQPGFTDFSGGQAPQVAQQQPPDVRSAMYTRLMQAGFPEEAAKYAPTIAPIKLGKGDRLVDPKTYQPLTDMPPMQDDQPDKVRQYQFAVENDGFEGSYIDFLKIVPEAQAAIMYPWRAAEADDRDRRRDIDERKADYELPRPKAPQRATGFSVSDPNGVTHSFPTKQQADAFKRAIGGR